MSRYLVTYFSAGGVTAAVAQRLAEAIGADIFEIKPQKPYTRADINWMNPLSRCNKEKAGKKDVPVQGHVEDMDQYDTVFIGFPIWYGCAPNVVNTFCKGYSMAGKKIAAFATSGGSGIGKTAEKLAPYVEGAASVTALLFPASASAGQLKAWAESI